MVWLWQRRVSNEELLAKVDSLAKLCKEIKEDFDKIDKRFTSLKGYVYSKKKDMSDFEKEEKQQDLNNPIVPIEFHGYSK